MTKTVRINGVEQSVAAEAIVFEEFVNGLNRTLSAERKVIASIRINGQEITEQEESQYNTLPLDQVGEIEVDTANPADLAFATLTTLEQYLDRLVSSISRASTHYRGKNLVSADAYFAKSIDGLDLFVQTIGGIKLALRIGLNTQLALTEAELVSIMTDLLESKRQNNYVYLADLLEKDLVQNLSEWKNTIFPLMRKLGSS